MNKLHKFKKIRVVIYLLNLGGGAGKSAIQYANILTRFDYDVTIICGVMSGTNNFEKLDINVNLVVFNKKSNFSTIVYFLRFMRNQGSDFILVFGASNMVPYFIYSKLFGFSGQLFLRQPTSPLGLISSYSGIKRIVKRFLFKYSFNHADHIIALTKSMKLELENKWNVCSGKVSVITNGVSINSSIVIKNNTKSNIKKILCVARLSPQKDISTLLYAFSILNKKINSCLKIAGDGEECSKLQVLAKKLKISDSVFFLGHVSELHTLFSESDLLVLSSRYEGFGHVLIEALSYGIPVVSTNCPTGPAEIILDDSVGYLADVGDPDDLAEKILLALNRQFDRNRLVCRAMDFSEDRLSMNLINLFRLSK